MQECVLLIGVARGEIHHEIEIVVRQYLPRATTALQLLEAPDRRDFLAVIGGLQFRRVSLFCRCQTTPFCYVGSQRAFFILQRSLAASLGRNLWRKRLARQ